MPWGLRYSGNFSDRGLTTIKFVGQLVDTFQVFQTAALKVGFVEVHESVGGTVLWLRKKTARRARETHQRMCIDRLTNSATVYWTTLPGKLNSKTFRDVLVLEEWFALNPAIGVER